MKNRRNKRKKENLANLRTFFLACELKPESDFWSVIDPFAYDVKPAFIFGSLGVIGYEPEAYSIIDTDANSPPLLGYICTITHPETVLLLNKLKGFHGEDAFNYHNKKHVHAYTDVEEMHNAWCFTLSDKVLDHYRQIEQVEFGIFEDDEKLISLLEKIEEDS